MKTGEDGVPPKIRDGQKNSIAAWPVGSLYSGPTTSPIWFDQYGNPILNPASPYGMPPWQAMWSMNVGEIISSDSY